MRAQAEHLGTRIGVAREVPPSSVPGGQHLDAQAPLPVWWCEPCRLNHCSDTPRCPAQPRRSPRDDRPKAIVSLGAAALYVGLQVWTGSTLLPILVLLLWGVGATVVSVFSVLQLLKRPRLLGPQLRVSVVLRAPESGAANAPRRP